MFQRFINWLFSKADLQAAEVRTDCQFSNLRGYRIEDVNPTFVGYCIEVTDGTLFLVNDQKQESLQLQMRGDERTTGYVTKRWGSFKRRAKPGIELAVMQVTTLKGKTFYTLKEMKTHDYLDV